jgi:hypothetical protein
MRRSQWPRGLRRRSSAAHLLRLCVWIPPRHECLSVVSFVCCQVEVSATDWSLVQRNPTECGASLCVIKKPRKRGGQSPLMGCENTTTMGCNARKTNKQTNKQTLKYAGVSTLQTSLATFRFAVQSQFGISDIVCNYKRKMIFRAMQWHKAVQVLSLQRTIFIKYVT